MFGAKNQQKASPQASQASHVLCGFFLGMLEFLNIPLQTPLHSALLQTKNSVFTQNTKDALESPKAHLCNPLQTVKVGLGRLQHDANVFPREHRFALFLGDLSLRWQDEAEPEKWFVHAVVAWCLAVAGHLAVLATTQTSRPEPCLRPWLRPWLKTRRS